MRIVVTGADRAVGRGVAARLVGMAHDVVGVGARRPESWPGPVDFVIDTAYEADVLKGADAVLHCGGSATLPALLDAMTTADVARLVAVSPSWPDGDAEATAEIVERSGVEAVVVRTAIVLGRHVDDAVLRLGTSAVFIDVAGSADRPIRVVHAHDVERVLVRALLDPGVPSGPVDVAADGHTTLRAVAAAVGRPVLTIPGAIPRRLRRLVQSPQPALPDLDTTALQRRWGFTPGYDVAGALADFALACRGRVAIGPAVHDVPWRLPRVLQVPAYDAPAPDGVQPVPASSGAANGEFDTPIDPRFPAFIATNLSEALAGPFSPSSASVTVRGTRAAGLVISQRLRPGGAVQHEMSVRTTGVFGHRLYAGITTGHFMAHTVPFINPDLVLSGFFGHTEDGLELFGEHLPPVEPRGVLRQLRGGLTFANCLIGLSAGSRRDTGDFVADVARLESACEDPARLDDRRLRELILLARDHVVHGWVLSSASILLCAGYGVVMRLLCGRDVMPAAGDELVSAQALGAVHRLAAVARREPAAMRLLAEPAIDATALSAQAPEFSAALRRELTLIGHRGPGEVEMRCATYADDPTLMIRMVAKALVSEPRDLPVLPKVPLPGRPVAVAAAAQIREREVRRDRMVRAIWLLRRLLREQGRRLVDTGELTEVDDVFYLLVDELDAPPPDLAGIVARRRAEQARLQQLDPPEAFSGRWVPTDAPAAHVEGGEVLHGIGVSGGRVRGLVRVVGAETIDDLLPGEILVAKVTDVGYTPAFAYAAAVVTELGGPTSHAAIVAREFGVPCVVNARGAAARLSTGTMIEVDGATGDVTVLGA
ncbi:PEP-utilizing enzyme [Mycolicibacterium sp. 050158]|uniref:PEP-utilizing enzyme n=1 Tax=Mycolicibacterium sp. 050158 TaxID=3090602 RepID=UPI00299ED57A|nr:PEP-utilizing enzyme [Mycolicibacterium sp. 050158]MDX1889375.1 PEP-utilizing enzyme [Mycolicibacterium sp. 050158]